ncbi:E3 ubiquitin-protein ligase RNF170 [Hyalella azteca]|uniref:E3 ubiquitin-protein ligase RNF170 n=1 Tax=Hyalella azteca TaxID=294128 RepID=A0A8B7NMR4_HYAAZ|nr:E3 ubiquitin-protein ligase RNF170 [Hyalella azteca]
MVRTRPDDDQTECPVCLDKVRFGAETNCGHLFCGDCILRVWEENVNRTACIACPCCRQDVKMLLSCHSSAESSATSRAVIEEREHNKQRLADYNRLHSHDASYWDHVRELPTVLRHVWAELFTWDGLQFIYRIRIILLMVAGFLYALIPFDLLPEAVLGIIGLLDDFLIVGYLLIQISVLFRNQIAQ